MRGANLAVSTVCTLVFGATPIFVKYFEDGKFHKFLKAGEAFFYHKFLPQLDSNIFSYKISPKNWVSKFCSTNFALLFSEHFYPTNFPLHFARMLPLQISTTFCKHITPKNVLALYPLLYL